MELCSWHPPAWLVFQPISIRPKYSPLWRLCAMKLSGDCIFVTVLNRMVLKLWFDLTWRSDFFVFPVGNTVRTLLIVWYPAGKPWLLPLKMAAIRSDFRAKSNKLITIFNGRCQSLWVFPDFFESDFWLKGVLLLHFQLRIGKSDLRMKRP